MKYVLCDCAFDCVGAIDISRRKRCPESETMDGNERDAAERDQPYMTSAVRETGSIAGKARLLNGFFAVQNARGGKISLTEGVKCMYYFRTLFMNGHHRGC